LVSLLFVLEPSLRTVSATPSLATNWNDEYVQSWTGLRPSVATFAGYDVNLYQRVISHNVDNYAEAFLSTEVYQLHHSGSDNSADSVSLRLTMNANSRYGIGYYYTTGSLPSPYPTSYTGWTNLGGVEGWVTLQHPLIFYGDYQ